MSYTYKYEDGSFPKKSFRHNFFWEVSYGFIFALLFRILTPESSFAKYFTIYYSIPINIWALKSTSLSVFVRVSCNSMQDYSHETSGFNDWGESRHTCTYLCPLGCLPPKSVAVTLLFYIAARIQPDLKTWNITSHNVSTRFFHQESLFIDAFYDRKICCNMAKVLQICLPSNMSYMHTYTHTHIYTQSF